MNVGYEYIPNEIESDAFLSEIPLSLMKENIKAQFEDPLEHRKKDHITTFINMYKYSLENSDEFEDEEHDSVIELRDDFYSFMQQMFMEYLGIGFNNFDDMSMDEQDDLIHYTYRFFLMNIKKNFVSVVLNSINRNRDSYTYDEEKKKDVTTLSFKKEITDPVDIYIISNLYDIINSILEQDIEIDQFIEDCDNDDIWLETRFVYNKVEDFTITGNFISNYIDMIDGDFKSEIESKVRNKILKKYKKK